MNAAEFDACCARHHDLERAARKITAFAIVEEQERIESMRFYSAKERYELMERKYPGITKPGVRFSTSPRISERPR